MSNKTASIILPYWMQRDDLSACIVHNADGTMNVKESLTRHIHLLQAAIDKLQMIHDTIPDDNRCILNADTHYISIYGDDAIVQTLVDQELATIEEFDDEPETESIEELPNINNSSWLDEWQKTCADYEQAYIDTFSQNPKSKNNIS